MYPEGLEVKEMVDHVSNEEAPLPRSHRTGSLRSQVDEQSRVPSGVTPAHGDRSSGSQDPQTWLRISSPDCSAVCFISSFTNVVN